jgi:hypothetical protein
MFTQAIPSGSRRRALDRQKKQLFCDTVARGATMTEAAVALGVSLRTVQREARRDQQFDQALRDAHHAPSADPLTLMKSHARRHWRATAWLLERERPEQYGRRPASSCSPFRFDQALRTVLEAALEATPAALRDEVYQHVQQACEAAFKNVFPAYGPCGRPLQPAPAQTPLADAQRAKCIRIIPDEPLWSPSLTEAAPAALPATPPPASPGPCAPSEPAPPQRRAAPGRSPGLKRAAAAPFTPRLSHRYPLRAAATLNQLDPAALGDTLTERFLSLLSPPTQGDTTGDSTSAPAPHSAAEPKR